MVPPRRVEPRLTALDKDSAKATVSEPVGPRPRPLARSSWHFESRRSPRNPDAYADARLLRRQTRSPARVGRGWRPVGPTAFVLAPFHFPVAGGAARAILPDALCHSRQSSARYFPASTHNQSLRSALADQILWLARRAVPCATNSRAVLPATNARDQPANAAPRPSDQSSPSACRPEN